MSTKKDRQREKIKESAMKRGYSEQAASDLAREISERDARLRGKGKLKRQKKDTPPGIGFA